MRPLGDIKRALVITSTLLVFLTTINGCRTPKGNGQDGKRWYMMHNCNSCHGLHGNDGRAPDIADLDMGFGRFIKKLRTTDAPVMPTFPVTKVSKQDAADIYAYLKSVNKQIK